MEVTVTKDAVPNRNSAEPSPVLRLAVFPLTSDAPNVEVQVVVDVVEDVDANADQ